MKNVFLLFLTILLTGCFLGYDSRGFRDVYIVNTFFNNLYVDPKIEKIVNLKMLDVEYINNIDYNKVIYISVFDFKNYVHKKNFYQDQEQNCYLFSMTNKELFDMEEKFSKSHKGQTPIFLIEKDGILYAFTQFFMPKNKVEYLQATDGVPYDLFVKKGLITISGENYVDYKDVFNWYVWLMNEYGIRVLKIGYDRYSAQYLIDDLKNYGFHTDDVHQGENLTPVIREFEGIIKDGNFKIVNNNLLKSHFLNVALKQNMETRKFRPIKIEQRAHIDGFVSVIDAMTVRQKYYAEVGEMLKNAA